MSFNIASSYKVEAQRADFNAIATYRAMGCDLHPWGNKNIHGIYKKYICMPVDIVITLFLKLSVGPLS
jgi:hypothetical protein